MRGKKAKHLRRLARAFGDPNKPERNLVAIPQNKTTAFNHPLSTRGQYRTLKANPHLIRRRAL